jgi:hypothetical protein
MNELMNEDKIKMTQFAFTTPIDYEKTPSA